MKRRYSVAHAATSPGFEVWRALCGGEKREGGGASSNIWMARVQRAMRPAQMLMVQINLLITGLGGLSYWIAFAASGGKHFAIPFGQSVFRWLHRPVLDIALCFLCFFAVGMLQWRRLRARRGAWSAVLFAAGISFLAQSLIGYAMRVLMSPLPFLGYFAAWGLYLVVQSRRWSAGKSAAIGTGVLPASASGASGDSGGKAADEERIELIISNRKRSSSFDA